MASSPLVPDEQWAQVWEKPGSRTSLFISSSSFACFQEAIKLSFLRPSAMLPLPFLLSVSRPHDIIDRIALTFSAFFSPWETLVAHKGREWASQRLAPVYKKIAVPKPREDEVLIQVLYSGVCHSDFDLMMGRTYPVSPAELPVVSRHEGAGVVVACGGGIQEFDVGDRVGIKIFQRTCLICDFCRNGKEICCPQVRLAGYHVAGTFQQYAVVQTAHVTRLLAGCDLASSAPILCAGTTAYRGLRQSGVRPGQFVTIVGAGGGLGHLALQYARAMGMRVVAVDGGPEKRDLCLRFGAHAYVDFQTSEDLVAEAKAATPDGLGSHALLVMGSNETAYKRVLEHVRPGGVIVCIGFPRENLLNVPISDLALQQISIKGSLLGSRDDFTEALDFAQRGLVKPLIKIVGLSELQDVFELFQNNKIQGRYVLDTSK